jgi:hypothetical protein
MMASSSSLFKILLNKKVTIYIHEINIIILLSQQQHWNYYFDTSQTLKTNVLYAYMELHFPIVQPIIF